MLICLCSVKQHKQRSKNVSDKTADHSVGSDNNCVHLTFKIYLGDSIFLTLIKYFFCFQGFGQADHTITVEKLKKAYPDYQSITFSNEGY